MDQEQQDEQLTIQSRWREQKHFGAGGTEMVFKSTMRCP
jgi:hypothetical protein